MTASAPDPLEDLTSEKTLLDVYRNVVRRLPSKRSYTVATIVVAVLVFLATYLSPLSAAELGARAREWCNFLAAYVVGIVAILLAGFTFLQLLAMSDLVGPMVSLKEPKSGLSYLKYVAGHFMRVFIPYVLFLFIFAFVMLFGFLGGPATLLANWLGSALGPWAARALSAVGLSLLGGYFAHLLLEIQGFVFNVYASFMFMARGKLELDRRRQKTTTSSAAPVPAAVSQPTATAPSEPSTARIGQPAKPELEERAAQEEAEEEAARQEEIEGRHVR
jgi:hypothetical protein